MVIRRAVLLLSLGLVSLVFCEQRKLMSVDDYIFYRKTEKFRSEGDATDILKKYRLPTEEEKRSYLSNGTFWVIDANQGWSPKSGDMRTFCSWLIQDDPSNATAIVDFVNEKNRAIEQARLEYFSKRDGIEPVVRHAIIALSALGEDAMPYYMEFLKTTNGVLHEGAMLGISELFKNKDISEEMKKVWIREFIDLVWYPDSPCRKPLVAELLQLDRDGYAPMDIKDWISICAGETNIEIYQSVYDLHPKEFLEWQKKEGGFRPLVWE